MAAQPNGYNSLTNGGSDRRLKNGQVSYQSTVTQNIPSYQASGSVLQLSCSSHLILGGAESSQIWLKPSSGYLVQWGHYKDAFRLHRHVQNTVLTAISCVRH